MGVYNGGFEWSCGKGGSDGVGALVVCFGEMLINFVPPKSGYLLAEPPSFEKVVGRAPENVAVGVSRLGDMLADILRDNKVNNSGMRFDDSARTALPFVTNKADGEREFLFFRLPRADMLLQESELNVDLIKKAGIFHCGSISLIDESCRSAHIAAMRIAKSEGSLLSYDPNLRLQLWTSSARDLIMAIWDQVDIIKISEEGREGCRYYTKELKGRVRGIEVNAIDTTAAGDSCVCGLLYALAADPHLHADEEWLTKASRFANACGVVTVTKRGAIPTLPTKGTAHEKWRGAAA